jgi:hypothetical protein
MYRRTHLVSLTIFVATVCGLTLAVSAQERERSKVSDKYTWDLTHIGRGLAGGEGHAGRRVPEAEGVQGHAGVLGRAAR